MNIDVNDLGEIDMDMLIHVDEIEYDIHYDTDDTDDDDTDDSPLLFQVFGDNLIGILILHTIYEEIKNHQVTIIQRVFKDYIQRKRQWQNTHRWASAHYLEDICQFAYYPPDKTSEIPLLQKGGFCYRWAENRFDLNKSDCTDIICL